MNVTVAFEYAAGKVILGLDEPGYLLADKKSLSLSVALENGVGIGNSNEEETKEDADDE